MNVPRFASAAAKLLRGSLPGETPVTGDRARGVATIERAMLARARRRRWRWGGAALTTAAAAFVLLRAGSWLSARPELVSINVSPAGHGAALRAGDHAEALPERAALASGQRIETPWDGGASLRLSTGTSIDLAGNTVFRVDSQGRTERFSLQQGELSAHVAKLSAGQRFIIATPDAEVEVRGTRFRVHVLNSAEACGAGSRTRLEVTEGIVEVRAAGATVNVTAGQEWPSDCTKAQPTQAAPASLGLPRTAASANALVESPRPDGSRPNTTPSTDHKSPTRAVADHSSELAQQNDLFAEGVALRQQGDVAGALRAYQALIARFPAGPLAENALVERMRLLSNTRDPRARAEAERYIARYPRGFALREAKHVAGVP